MAYLPTGVDVRCRLARVYAWPGERSRRPAPDTGSSSRAAAGPRGGRGASCPRPPAGAPGGLPWRDACGYCPGPRERRAQLEARRRSWTAMRSLV